MKSMISNVRGALQARREAKQDWNRIEHELAGYASPADRLDLGSTLDRYPDSDTDEMRRFLSAQTSQVL